MIHDRERHAGVDETRYERARKRSIDASAGLQVPLQPRVFIGAGDRNRTGDVQLGKLAFCR